MKRLRTARFAALVLVAGAVLSGCATDLSSAVMPGVQVPELSPVYVVCNPQENADICALIAAFLEGHGIRASRGDADAIPPTAVAVVTYEDRWMWDGLLYLLTLRVDLRDPKTNVLLATARSFRTSLARKTPTTVVRQVVGALFDEGKAA